MLSHDTLVAEHLDIETTAADLLLHARQRPLDPVAVATARWSLSRKLLAHLAKEDLLLYPMLRRSPAAAVADLARRSAEEVGGLADGFKAYIRHWTSEAIAGDADGFERDTQAVLAALHARILHEESQLYRHIPGAPASPKVDGSARAA
ncbi:hemerythrin domain-containing protein [uncultured Sphingomonas sp.]|uniref:hemerythrin domain-containing protein n=1 Tax=uncultured Sphingomonas sp. TaxID=158754 RepID=UPI0025F20125|nr:hemerythrin domain-containing protein [uncultured Sphingomonas sp.]